MKATEELREKYTQHVAYLEHLMNDQNAFQQAAKDLHYSEGMLLRKIIGVHDCIAKIIEGTTINDAAESVADFLLISPISVYRWYKEFMSPTYRDNARKDDDKEDPKAKPKEVGRFAPYSWGGGIV